MTLQAGAPAPAILTALESAGWGDLAGHDMRGVRQILTKLIELLQAPKSAEGSLAIGKLAERAGYSTRWTTRCLNLLEDLGLIDWKRGHVADGKPVPSYFRVDKRVLFVLWQIAKRSRDEHFAKLRAATQARLAGLRSRYVKSKRGQNRRSVHVELSSTPTFTGSKPGREAGPVDNPDSRDLPSAEERERLQAAVRAQLRPTRPHWNRH